MKVIKNICFVLVIGFAVYKLYEKFFKDSIPLPEFLEDEPKEFEADLEAEAEESLADKIRSATRKVFN